MKIKEVFEMLEKHNQLAELFQQPHLKPMRIRFAAFGYYSNHFTSFEQFKDYVIEEFIEPVVRAILNAEIRNCGTNYLTGINDVGEIIMDLSIYEE